MSVNQIKVCLHNKVIFIAATSTFSTAVTLSLSPLAPPPPTSVCFGEPVDASRHQQLMLPHLPLQEAFQLINVHLRDDGSRGDEHPEHGVDAVQCHAVQVSQHGLDVGPEQLQRGGGGRSEVMQGLFVWLILILNYMGALHKHDL